MTTLTRTMLHKNSSSYCPSSVPVASTVVFIPKFGIMLTVFRLRPYNQCPCCEAVKMWCLSVAKEGPSRIIAAGFNFSPHCRKTAKFVKFEVMYMKI